MLTVQGSRLSKAYGTGLRVQASAFKVGKDLGVPRATYGFQQVTSLPQLQQVASLPTGYEPTTWGLQPVLSHGARNLQLGGGVGRGVLERVARLCQLRARLLRGQYFR